MLSFLLTFARHPQNAQTLRQVCNISRKKLGIKLIFCMQLNTKVFDKLILPFLTGVGRHAQSTQNNKFALT